MKFEKYKEIIKKSLAGTSDAFEFLQHTFANVELFDWPYFGTLSDLAYLLQGMLIAIFAGQIAIFKWLKWF